MCRVADGRDDELARELDLVARRDRPQFARQPAAVEPRELPQDLLHRLDRFGRHVDDGRRHLHHPPPGDVHRQRRDVVEMAVRDEPRFGAHERPRLAAQIEAELQLGKPPVGLHGGARVAFDRQVAVLERLDRQVVDHRRRKTRRRAGGSGEWRAAIVEAGRPKWTAATHDSLPRSACRRSRARGNKRYARCRRARSRRRRASSAGNGSSPGSSQISPNSSGCAARAC